MWKTLLLRIRTWFGVPQESEIDILYKEIIVDIYKARTLQQLYVIRKRIQLHLSLIKAKNKPLELVKRHNILVSHWNAKYSHWKRNKRGSYGPSEKKTNEEI